ncbi:MAG: arylesterase, partial [Pseudomonadota bacterium]
MGLRLFLNGFLTYGVRALRGKAVALVLMASPAWAEPVTVLALGDSLTQGYGLSAEDGFVPKLQKWLV